MADDIEEIKRKIDIVDLISSYITLKKSGANYKCLCPFHKEKTPSFMVSPEKQIFKCFGCQAGGSIFDFVMQIENLTFPEALKLLADKAGVRLKPLRKIDIKQDFSKNRLYQINLLAAKLYHKILTVHPSGKKALNYLQKQRKLKNETISQFLLGFAPEKWDLILKKLQEKGYSREEIFNAGLAVRKDNGEYFDRFKGRIIFPIYDILNNIVGFSARLLEDKVESPKYLNSADSPIFHKSRLLYGLNLAKQHIKKNGFAILVEGQMDVIASYQAGIKNILASSGTALTEEHLQVLKRFTANIILAFDSDQAGITAVKRAIDLALLEDFSVKIAILKKFKDPGEAALEDRNYWINSLKNSLYAVDWYFQEAFNKIDPDTELNIRQKKQISKILIPIIFKIQNPIEKAHYISLISRRLNVKEEIIIDILKKYTSKSKFIQNQVSGPKPVALDIEEYFLGLILVFSKYLPEIEPKIKKLSFKNENIANVVNQILICYNKSGKDNFATKVITFLKNNVPALVFDRINILIFTVEQQFKDEKDDDIIIAEIFETINRLENRQSENIKQNFALKIAQAEQQGDKKKLKSLILELQHAISEKENHKN